MQPAQAPRNTDELRILGLISFVSVLVGCAVAVFDAGLWLKDDSTQTNGLTYTMGAFTLQGMGYFLWKMLAQDSMDQKASLANMQKSMTRQMQKQQMGFAQKQMEIELKKQEMLFSHQLQQLEEDPEVVQYLALQQEMQEAAEEAMNAPNHEANNKKPMKLGANKPRNADGTYKKSKKE
tara:strand:+ start:6334 stop:6870 length:537 start_codon:yes stop_codon:yes gene_type:complete